MQVAWISGPWFLSIFVNILPWDSGEFFFFMLQVLIPKKKVFFYLCFAEVVFHLDVFSSADVGCASL